MRQHRHQKKRKTENKHTGFGEPWGNIKLSSILGTLVPEGGEEKGKAEKWFKEVMAKFENKHYELTDPRNSRNSNQKNHKIRPRHMIKQNWWKTMIQLKILKSSHIKEDTWHTDTWKAKGWRITHCKTLTRESWSGNNNFRCKVTSKQGILPGMKRNIA